MSAYYMLLMTLKFHKKNSFNDDCFQYNVLNNDLLLILSRKDHNNFCNYFLNTHNYVCYKNSI